ncbi:hypothetical protein F5Y12DRAFT_334268 [Xylaria sp. FL1777]|nr:hypothetical protein F5Y12DRAFT_334268 [Xylaria sp. FL1777]
MADGSCGPSNAFKGLTHHIEQDRSHQQDRVGPGPQYPAQNFRTTPLNSGLTDQFGAFQNQNAALPQHPSMGWKPYSHSANPPPLPAQAPSFFTQQPTPQAPGFATSIGGSWVNDFQRMSFADAHTNPLHTQSTRGPIPGQPSMASPMRSDYATEMLLQQPAFQSPLIGVHPTSHQAGMFPTMNSMQKPEFIENASLAFDAQADAILEQEFEDAMNEWMLQNGPGAEMSDQNELSAQDGHNLIASLDAATTEPTADDAPEKDSAESRDDLARAAQELVDSLSDNSSEKFRNSHFIALMRRIASQELTVQGNDLVETQPSANTSSGSHVIDAASAISSPPTNGPDPPAL